MKIQIIFAISMLVIGIVLSVVMAIDDTEIIDSIGVFEVIDNKSLKLLTIPAIVDYEEEGYVQVNPENKTRFIYLECINSTLIIDDNKIYCQR